jgi:hypothetical protein
MNNHFKKNVQFISNSNKNIQMCLNILNINYYIV